MEAMADSWGEKPLDLVKKKIPVAVVTPSSMGVNNIRKTDLGADTPRGEDDSLTHVKDGEKEFYRSVNHSVEESKINKNCNEDDDKNKHFYKIQSPPWEEDSGVGTLSPLAVSEQGPSDYGMVEVKKECGISPNGDYERRPYGNVDQGASLRKDCSMDLQGEILKGMREDVSRFAMQSPNLYSALKGKDGGLQDPTVCEVKRPATPKKEPPGISAAYLEVFDKLMVDYVKKISGQNTTDPLKPEGLYSIIHRLAACEQKFWSALYMGSLLNSSLPGLGSGLPGLGHTLPPILSSSLPSQLSPQLQQGVTGINSGLNPGVNPTIGSCLPLGMPGSLPPGLHPGLLPGLGTGLLGFQQSSLLSAAYHTFGCSTPSATATSASTSSTMTSNSSPILSSRLQDSQLRLKELMLWRTCDRQSSTPSSSHTSYTSTADLSSSSVKSSEESMSASSSVRSSSVPSPLNLALSPMSSIGASPPLSTKSDSHSRMKHTSSKRSVMDHQKNSSGANSHGPKGQDSGNGSSSQDKKKEHIKKPLNAFMLFMRETRAKVVEECTLKESAAINQILGRRWHSLSREEQAKYYEKARYERQRHMQLYPAWSARDNYGYGAKKKKRKKERVPVDTGGNNLKKCRARYGLDQQSQWCKPCRRKKKCIRYMEAGGSGGGGDDGNQSDDNLGSCGSIGDGDAHTPVDEDDDGDETMSQSQSLSSPGGLSGLSSLTSPSMILPSPSTSLASPSVSLASPCMSLQSPLTPLEYECKPLPPPLPLPLPLPMYNHQHSPLLGPPLHRHPVGTNPHDINNPLSVNQLTGKCIKTETNSTASSGSGGAMPGPSAAAASAPAPPNIIRVT